MLQFFLCVSIVSYEAFVLSLLFVPHCPFFWCRQKAMLRDFGISYVFSHILFGTSFKLTWAEGSRGAIVITHRPSSSSVRPTIISLNNIYSLTKPILIKFHRNDSWVVLIQNCSKILNSYILVAIATQRKNFENLFVRNHLADFIITWQKCSFSDRLSRLFKTSWFVRKHGARVCVCVGGGGGGVAGRLFSLFIDIENLKKKKKKFLSETTGLMHYNLAELFLWWPSTKIVQVIMNRQKHGRRGRGLFSLYIYIENFKRLLMRNHLTNFDMY